MLAVREGCLSECVRAVGDVDCVGAMIIVRERAVSDSNSGSADA